MGDENPICTLGDYSKPSHEGYRNTIELPAGNNVVPLRSDTIRLVQNGCSFHKLRSEDPNQHLKDFLKLVDSLDLGGDNKERARLRLFQFSLRDQASNWLESLSAGSISTWEDLTTRFLAQFFPPGRTVKLHNDILMFQQHHGESLSEAWTRFKDLLQKFPHHGIDLWFQALLEDLFLYDNKSWNDPRDFAKPVKAIALPQDVPSTSDHRLIELENQVQRLMGAHLAPTQPTQVNKITTLCEICSGPHDTQYCIEDPKQAFVEYASSRTDEAGAPKCVHFVNSIVILSTDSDTEEEDVSSTNACDLNLGGMEKRKEGVKEQGKEENEMETDMEVDEVFKELSEFETDEELSHVSSPLEMCASTPEEVAYMKKVPYASAVGSIMYAVRCTRPDVAFAQNLVSRYQQNPGKLHWVAVKHILKYLRNTRDMFLVYGGKPDTELNVTGFCDASWQSDKDDTKSQTGYVFVVNGGAVDWKSKKQTTIAMSATQAEYMAASEAAMEAVWIRKFVGDLGVMPSIKKPIDMYCDNSAAIIFANDSGVMKGARHFLRRYHYVREQVESGEIKILKVHTDDNLADPFTKALPRGKVTDLGNGIGLQLASSFMHTCD
ncbi:retrotransposon protein, putative, ty1-copia subclass [Tanacetum coccineum]